MITKDDIRTGSFSYIPSHTDANSDLQNSLAEVNVYEFNNTVSLADIPENINVEQNINLCTDTVHDHFEVTDFDNSEKVYADLSQVAQQATVYTSEFENDYLQPLGNDFDDSLRVEISTAYDNLEDEFLETENQSDDATPGETENQSDDAAPGETENYYSAESDFQENHLVKNNDFYQCKICSSRYIKRFKLKMHYKRVHPDCPELLSQIILDMEEDSKYQKENESQKNKKFFQCEICPSRYIKRFRLKMHYKKVHPECTELLTQIILAMKEDSKYRTENESQKNTKFFQCEICSSRYVKRFKLKMHYKKVHPESTELLSQVILDMKKDSENQKELSCDLCGIVFYERDHLIIHHRAIHLGENLFMCHFCHKSYKSRARLINHVTSLHEMTPTEYHAGKSSSQSFKNVELLKKGVRDKKLLLNKFKRKRISNRAPKPKLYENYIISPNSTKAELKKRSISEKIKLNKVKKGIKTNAKRSVPFKKGPILKPKRQIKKPIKFESFVTNQTSVSENLHKKSVQCPNTPEIIVKRPRGRPRSIHLIPKLGALPKKPISHLSIPTSRKTNMRTSVLKKLHSLNVEKLMAEQQSSKVMDKQESSNQNLSTVVVAKRTRIPELVNSLPYQFKVLQVSLRDLKFDNMKKGESMETFKVNEIEPLDSAKKREQDLDRLINLLKNQSDETPMEETISSAAAEENEVCEPEQQGLSENEVCEPEQQGLSENEECEPEQQGLSENEECEPEQQGLSENEECEPEQQGLSENEECEPEQQGLSENEECEPEQQGLSENEVCEPEQQGVSENMNEVPEVVGKQRFSEPENPRINRLKRQIKRPKKLEESSTIFTRSTNIETSKNCISTIAESKVKNAKVDEGKYKFKKSTKTSDRIDKKQFSPKRLERKRLCKPVRFEDFVYHFDKEVDQEETNTENISLKKKAGPRSKNEVKKHDLRKCSKTETAMKKTENQYEPVPKKIKNQMSQKHEIGQINRVRKARILPEYVYTPKFMSNKKINENVENDTIMERKRSLTSKMKNHQELRRKDDTEPTKNKIDLQLVIPKPILVNIRLPTKVLTRSKGSLHSSKSGQACFKFVPPKPIKPASPISSATYEGNTNATPTHVEHSEFHETLPQNNTSPEISEALYPQDSASHTLQESNISTIQESNVITIQESATACIIRQEPIHANIVRPKPAPSNIQEPAPIEESETRNNDDEQPSLLVDIPLAVNIADIMQIIQPKMEESSPLKANQPMSTGTKELYKRDDILSVIALLQNSKINRVQNTVDSSCQTDFEYTTEVQNIDKSKLNNAKVIAPEVTYIETKKRRGRPKDFAKILAKMKNEEDTGFFKPKIHKPHITFDKNVLRRGKLRSSTKAINGQLGIATEIGVKTMVIDRKTPTISSNSKIKVAQSIRVTERKTKSKSAMDITKASRQIFKIPAQDNYKSAAIAKKSSPYQYSYFFDNNIVKKVSIVVDKLDEDVYRKISQGFNCLTT